MDRRILIVSDIDNTLLGDDDALRAFVAWRESVSHDIRLAYSSGRFRDSIETSIRQTPLPTPDAIISGVGTEITVTATGEQLNDWPPHAAAWNPAAIRDALRGQWGLELQPADCQSQWKVSYFGYDLSDDDLQRLRDTIAQLGIPAAVVYSSNRDLDILPADTDKGSAAAHLAEHWRYEQTEVVVCGDSGNDLAMFQQGFRGVVVNNAHPELKALTGDANVYLSSRDFAAGVLEGVQHWLERMGK